MQGGGGSLCFSLQGEKKVRWVDIRYEEDKDC